MKRLALLLAALVALVVVPAASASAATDDTPRLQRQGRFLVDQYGRVVIVHGLNMVWKRAPYAPPDTAAGFTAKDAAWLEKYGFNGARLGVLWAGVTPDQPGVADPAYFKRVDRMTKLLADKKIWMLFDGHQDQWHEQYGGEGVPACAAKRPMPFALTPYLPVPFPQGLLDPRGLHRLRQLLGQQGRPARARGRRRGSWSRSTTATSPTRWATTCSTSRGPGSSGRAA